MLKEKYDRSKLEIIIFQTDDVILTSGFGDEYEGWNPGSGSGSSGGEGYEGWNPH